MTQQDLIGRLQSNITLLTLLRCTDGPKMSGQLPDVFMAPCTFKQLPDVAAASQMC